MLIEERARGPVLVDEEGVEVRPGEAVVFEGGVHFLGWVEGYLVALVRKPQSASTKTALQVGDLLVLPEMLSRARSANNDRRPPASFTEFAETMEGILYDIVGMAGCPPLVAQPGGAVSNLACSIETRAFHALRLLLDYKNDLSQRPPPSPPKASKPAPTPRAA
jgi:hypothetical protein